MAHGCTNTIITSVTAANHDDVFSPGIDVSAILQLRVQKGFCIQLKKISTGVIETRLSIPEGIPLRSGYRRRFGWESLGLVAKSRQCRRRRHRSLHARQSRRH